MLILGLFDQFSAVTISWQIASIYDIASSEVLAEDSIPSAFMPPPSTDDTNEDSPAITALNTAITAGYYYQIVVIYGKTLTNPYVVAAPNALREFEPISKEFKDYKIDIYTFE